MDFPYSLSRTDFDLSTRRKGLYEKTVGVEFYRGGK